ncbi:MAG: hypothetical protein JSV39_03620, partial [Candidatus Aenigmatarchaeota archaeon]
MTVVSFLRLNPESGMACADERETHTSCPGIQRTYDVHKKIYKLNDFSFGGYSGDAEYSSEIMKMAIPKIDKEASIEKVRETLKHIYQDVRTEKTRDHLLERFKLTFDDVSKGSGVNPELIMKGIEILNDPNSFGVTILFGGYDPKQKEFKIYRLTYPGGDAEVYRTTSIGSGWESADKVIGEYIDIMNPEQRENINPSKGAKILMEATRAAWRNIGVGGKTQLVWSDADKGIKELGWKESNILNNLVYLQKKEIVPV